MSALMHPIRTIGLAALLASLAIAGQACASDQIYDSPQHIACLQAPTPDCLFDLARGNADLGLSKDGPRYKLRRQIGLAQVRAGRAQDAIKTLSAIVKEIEDGGHYSQPNPIAVDYYIALALAQHAAGNEAAADISFDSARLNTGPVRQGYSVDRYASSGVRLAIALAETGRMTAAEEVLARAKDTIAGVKTQPYDGDIWGNRNFAGTLQQALVALAAAYAGADDFETALARARQIGDAEFLRFAGLNEDPDAAPLVSDNPMEFLSAMSGVATAGADGRVYVILSLTDIASIQLDRQDIAGARQTLAQAHVLADAIKDPSYGLANALSAIAPVEARAGDLAAALASAEKINELCCKNPKGVRNPTQYATVLHEIAAAIIASQPDEAADVLSNAEDAARNIEFVGARHAPLTQIAILVARLGDTAHAKELFLEAAESVGHINDNATDVLYPTVEPMRAVAAGLAEMGDIAGALELARQPQGSSLTLFPAIAQIQLDRSDFAGAESMLLEGYRLRAEWIAKVKAQNGTAPQPTPEPIVLDADAVPVLAHLAVLQAKAGTIDLANRTLARAFEAIAPLETPEAKDWYAEKKARFARADTLVEIAKAQAATGDGGAAKASLAEALEALAPIAAKRTGSPHNDLHLRKAWVEELTAVATAQATIGDADGASGTFAEAIAGARLIDILSVRVSALLSVANALVETQRRDEALALLDVARQDSEELMNNLRPHWVGADSDTGRTALRIIAGLQASLGDMNAAFETSAAIIDPKLLRQFGGFARTYQLARETALRDVIGAMVKAGRTEDAAAAATDLSIPFLRGEVLAEVAAALPPDGQAAGKDAKTLLAEARGLLERTDSPLSLDKVIASRAAGYAALARAAAAQGDPTDADAALRTAHQLAGELPDAAMRINALLAAARAEHAIGNAAAAAQSIDEAISVADTRTDFFHQVDLYPAIVLQQAQLEGEATAAETVRHMFSFYYPNLGGTGGTVDLSVRFPVVIAELMSRLKVDRFDTTPLPPRRQ